MALDNDTFLLAFPQKRMFQSYFVSFSTVKLFFCKFAEFCSIFVSFAVFFIISSRTTRNKKTFCDQSE